MTSEQQAGKLQFTEQEDTFVLKLTGDVRLTLCTALDCAIKKLFEKHQYTQIIVDLSEAKTLDSTTLGLLAKLAIFAKKNYQIIPILETANEDIIRLLESMGIQDSFVIQTGQNTAWHNLQDLTESPCNEEFIKKTILDAHRILMDVNDNNKAAFKDLVHTLEAQ